jgi:hypothetical protein
MPTLLFLELMFSESVATISADTMMGKLQPETDRSALRSNFIKLSERDYELRFCIG